MAFRDSNATLNQVGRAVSLAADMSATLAVGAAEGSWMEGAEGLGVSARVVEGAPSAGTTEASKGESTAGESVGISEGGTAAGVEDEVPAEICRGRGRGLGSIERFAIKRFAFIIEARGRAWKGSFRTFLPSGITRTSSSDRLDTTSLDDSSLSVDSRAF